MQCNANGNLKLTSSEKFGGDLSPCARRVQWGDCKLGAIKSQTWYPIPWWVLHYKAKVLVRQMLDESTIQMCQTHVSHTWDIYIKLASLSASPKSIVQVQSKILSKIGDVNFCTQGSNKTLLVSLSNWDTSINQFQNPLVCPYQLQF